MERKVRCPQGHRNTAGKNYCGTCGAPLAGVCPNGHENPPGNHFCGDCGGPLAGGETELRRPASKKQHADTHPQSGWADYTVPGTAESDVPLERSYFQMLKDSPGVLMLLLVALVLVIGAGFVFAFKDDGRHISKPTATSATPTPQGQANTYTPQMPVPTTEDWVRAVCETGTISAGNSALPGAVAADSCRSLQRGPMWIGKYNSALARDNDIDRFRGNLRHYATAVDDEGYIWLFAVPGELGAKALEPLRQFGFLVS